MADIDDKLNEFGFTFFDREGNKLTLYQYGELSHLPGYFRVARTQIDADTYVSTVWTGFDPHYLPADRTEMFGLPIPPILKEVLYHSAPLIFETAAFGKEGEIGRDRYTNEVAAIAGHDQMVALVRSELKE